MAVLSSSSLQRGMGVGMDTGMKSNPLAAAVVRISMDSPALAAAAKLAAAFRETLGEVRDIREHFRAVEMADQQQRQQQQARQRTQTAKTEKTSRQNTGMSGSHLNQDEDTRTRSLRADSRDDASELASVGTPKESEWGGRTRRKPNPKHNTPAYADRLIAEQNKHRNKMEKLRVEKMQKELSQITGKPVMNERSRKIMGELSSTSMHERMAKSKTMQKRRQDKLRKVLEAQDRETMTAKPKINERSRKMVMKRSIEDRQAHWKKQRDQKIAQQRKMQEKEEKQIRSTRAKISKGSERILKQKMKRKQQALQNQEDESDQTVKAGNRLYAQAEVYKERRQEQMHLRDLETQIQASPAIAPHSRNLPRHGDVSSRLYSLHKHQQKKKKDAVEKHQHMIETEDETGQKMFTPKINKKSRRMVRKMRGEEEDEDPHDRSVNTSAVSAHVRSQAAQAVAAAGAGASGGAIVDQLTAHMEMVQNMLGGELMDGHAEHHGKPAKTSAAERLSQQGQEYMNRRRELAARSAEREIAMAYSPKITEASREIIERKSKRRFNNNAVGDNDTNTLLKPTGNIRQSTLDSIPVPTFTPKINTSARMLASASKIGVRSPYRQHRHKHSKYVSDADVEELKRARKRTAQVGHGDRAEETRQQDSNKGPDVFERLAAYDMHGQRAGELHHGVSGADLRPSRQAPSAPVEHRVDGGSESDDIGDAGSRSKIPLRKKIAKPKQLVFGRRDTSLLTPKVDDKVPASTPQKIKREKRIGDSLYARNQKWLKDREARTIAKQREIEAENAKVNTFAPKLNNSAEWRDKMKSHSPAAIHNDTVASSTKKFAWAVKRADALASHDQARKAPKTGYAQREMKRRAVRVGNESNKVTGEARRGGDDDNDYGHELAFEDEYERMANEQYGYGPGQGSPDPYSSTRTILAVASAVERKSGGKTKKQQENHDEFGRQYVRDQRSLADSSSSLDEQLRNMARRGSGDRSLMQNKFSNIMNMLGTTGMK